MFTAAISPAHVVDAAPRIGGIALLVLLVAEAAGQAAPPCGTGEAVNIHFETTEPFPQTWRIDA